VDRVSRSALVRLGILGLIWGCSFLFIKVALEGLSPPQLVFGRVSCGALAVLVVLRARRERLPADRTIWVHLAAF
jgi:drug/metabolite transporter (DMT)-like permease